MATKMTHCPSCSCRIVIKKRRSFTDKLRGVASKYRCHDCSEQFENKKSLSQIVFGVRYS